MTPDLVVRGGTLVLPDGRRRADLWLVGDRIDRVTDDRADPSWPSLDADGLLVAPGYIDLQVNGGWGADITRDARSMWAVAARLPTHGVTAFLPTVVTAPPDAVAAAQTALRDAPGVGAGARPLGLHLEGPMINPAKRGAHAAEHIVAPSPDLVAGWAREDGITMVTLAPELPGAVDVIRHLVDRGVVVAGGHSAASVDEVGVALDAGLSHLTHLFNAMAPLAHRDPGIVGVGLAHPELTVGLIVDGLHVHPTAVAAVWNAKRPDGLVLVSDAASALGTTAGSHDLGDRRVAVDEAGAIRDRDGALAGSAITLDEAVRNLVAFTGCTPDEAIACASTTPARVIGATTKGTIAPGQDADLVLLDVELHVAATVVGGSVAWRS